MYSLYELGEAGNNIFKKHDIKMKNRSVSEIFNNIVYLARNQLMLYIMGALYITLGNIISVKFDF